MRPFTAKDRIAGQGRRSARGIGVANRVLCCCPRIGPSLWEGSGRCFPVSPSKPRSGTLSVPAQHEEWSRGCRRAHRSFWSWPLQLPLQPAPRKRRNLPRKSPSSLPIPASTSKITARAWRHSPAGPAAFRGLLRGGPRLFPSSSAAGSRHPRVARTARPARCPARSPARC